MHATWFATHFNSSFFAKSFLPDSWLDLMMSMQARYARFADKIVHLLNDEIDLQALIPDQSKVTNADHWSLDMGTRQLSMSKLRKWIGGYQENDIIIVGDVEEIPYADALNALKYCGPVSGKLPLSLGSKHTYRFNFKYILSRYEIAVPFVIPGPLANELVDRQSNFRSDIPIATKLWPYSTHCTTFGDIIASVMKELSTSEARDKVVANNVRMMSHPFEMEADTVALGIRVFGNRHAPNDRTQDPGWVGPVMCRYVESEISHSDLMYLKLSIITRAAVALVTHILR